MHEQVNQKIDAALDVLNFSYRVFFEVGVSGCMSLFKRPLSINNSVSVREENMDKQRAECILHNHIMSAVCSLVLILDEAVLNAFKNREPTGNAHIDNLRTVIYMLRCAFAHGPCDPRWKIEKNNRKNITLSSSDGDSNISKDSMNFDFTSLNTQAVQTEHFYGLKGLISISFQTQRLLLQQGEKESAIGTYEKS